MTSTSVVPTHQNAPFPRRRVFCCRLVSLIVVLYITSVADMNPTAWRANSNQDCNDEEVAKKKKKKRKKKFAYIGNAGSLSWKTTEISRGASGYLRAARAVRILSFFGSLLCSTLNIEGILYIVCTQL